MGTFTSIDRNIKQIAAVLGVLQSLTWIFLSIIYIFLRLTDTGYNNIIHVRSYTGVLHYFFFNFFIRNDSAFDGDRVLVPYHFVIFVVIYLIIDFIWLVASINLWLRKYNINNIKIALKVWSIVALMVCLIDFITAIILGTDYKKCQDGNYLYYLPEELSIVLNIVAEAICANAILPILTIAAKGFVLWIVNFIFAIVLFRISSNRKTLENHRVGQTYVQSQVQISSYPYSQNGIPQPQLAFQVAQNHQNLNPYPHSQLQHGFQGFNQQNLYSGNTVNTAQDFVNASSTVSPPDGRQNGHLPTDTNPVSPGGYNSRSQPNYQNLPSPVSPNPYNRGVPTPDYENHQQNRPFVLASPPRRSLWKRL